MVRSCGTDLLTRSGFWRFLLAVLQNTFGRRGSLEMGQQEEESLSMRLISSRG